MTLIEQLKANSCCELCAKAATELEYREKIYKLSEEAVARSAIELLHRFGLTLKEASDLASR